jgi:hypothetical protein
MNMDTCVEDARLVVDYLRERFHQEKIYVVGHPTAAFSGVLLCVKYPRNRRLRWHRQLANGAENERISYEFVLNEAQRRKDAKALKDLARIGWPQQGMYASLDDLMTQRNLMTKYGGAAHGKKDGLISSLVLPVCARRSTRSPTCTAMRWGSSTTCTSFGARWSPAISSAT